MKYLLVLFLILFPIVSGIGGYFLGKKFLRIRDYLFIGCNVCEMLVMVILILCYSSFSSSLISIPIYLRFKSIAATQVVPLPHIGSSTISPSLVQLFIWSKASP